MRTFVQVVWHHLNRNGIDDVQPRLAALQLILYQIISETGSAALPADRLAGVVQHLTIEHRLFTDLDVIGVRIKVNVARVFTDQQRADDGLTQVRRRIGTGNGFYGDGTRIKVDMAAGIVLIAVFYVVFRPGDQDFIQPPDVLDIVGKLAHQNIEAVGIFDVSFIKRVFLAAGTGDQHRRDNQQS